MGECVSTGDVGTMQNQYALHYSGTSLIRAPMGQKKVSFLGRNACKSGRVWSEIFLERCPQFRGVLIEGFHCIISLHTDCVRV